jgi:hypothetical protein
MRRFRANAGTRIRIKISARMARLSHHRRDHLEQFPVKWAHMQDNFGNAPEQ